MECAPDLEMGILKLLLLRFGSIEPFRDDCLSVAVGKQPELRFELLKET